MKLIELRDNYFEIFKAIIVIICISGIFHFILDFITLMPRYCYKGVCGFAKHFAVNYWWSLMITVVVWGVSLAYMRTISRSLISVLIVLAIIVAVLSLLIFI